MRCLLLFVVSSGNICSFYTGDNKGSLAHCAYVVVTAFALSYSFSYINLYCIFFFTINW